MDKIRVLQLGTEDWSGIYTVSEEIAWTYLETLEELPESPYDVVFLDRNPSYREISLLHKAVKAYTLFVTERVNMKKTLKGLFKCKMGRLLKADALQDFLQKELRYYYEKPYGEKLRNVNLAVSQDFKGIIYWHGNCYLSLQGEFGDEFYQIAFWRNNIPVSYGQTLEFWLEYEKSAEIEISMTITLIERGSVSKILNKWEFGEEALQQVVQIQNAWRDGSFFVSISAKGRGELKIIALHDRCSRCGHGYFLPGGERLVTTQREEVFCYFDPGDWKPPLNVYFSGFKTREGFEGYNLMRRFGAPFLLISEARLEGGAFYMGSPEYERMIVKAITKYRRKLGFSYDEVILSGLAMGAFGALCYGCELSPYALILGKPLANIGNVAVNETLNRPGRFPASLDVVMKDYDSADRETAKLLNARFWERFDGGYWRDTRFIVSYMIEDDYDSDVYEMLLSHLRADGVQVYGKGVHGRHNDRTAEIVNWFVSQYEKILKEDFGRELEE